MKCSVVILNWNGASMLRRFLPSVVQYCPADCEVVVADNGSTDDSLSVLQGFPSVRLICLDRNYGFAEGYNRALKAIDSEYVVLLNSDVELTEDFLSPILRYMDAHPDVAAVQPKVLHWTEDLHDRLAAGQAIAFEHAGAAGGELDILGYPFCRGRVLSRVEEDHGQYDTEADVFWASGCALVARTRIYKKVGGLDADFFAHMEEIDLCWRLQLHDYRVVCLPESRVFHVGGGSLQYGNPRKTYLNFRNNLFMLYKNLPTARLLWVMPLRLLLDYAALASELLHGRWAHARAIVSARLSYHRGKRTMRPKRKRNMQEATVRYPRAITRGSIFILALKNVLFVTK